MLISTSLRKAVQAFCIKKGYSLVLINILFISNSVQALSIFSFGLRNFLKKIRVYIRVRPGKDIDIHG